MACIHSLVSGENLGNTLLASPELVTKGHHTVGSVVSEILHHAEAFLDEVRLFCVVVPLLTRRGHCAPERKLWLHIDADQISSRKCGIRRTAGVETIVVDTIAL